MLLRVFLDDLRPAPPGWVPVQTYQQAISLLSTRQVKEISLDHDLGTQQTGYDVACWIEYKVFSDPDYIPPTIKVHSANPVGHKKILQVVERIARGFNNEGRR